MQAERPVDVVSEPENGGRVKSVRLQYFALLRERAGVSGETVQTEAEDAAALYRELAARHGFTLPLERLRVAINGDFGAMNAPVADGDEVVYIPPVAGG